MPKGHKNRSAIIGPNRIRQKIQNCHLAVIEDKKHKFQKNHRQIEPFEASRAHHSS